jgi:putative transposase
MSTIKFKAGELLLHKGRRYQFHEALNLREVIGVDVETGEKNVLPIPEIEPVAKGGASFTDDLSKIDEKALEREFAKFKAIEPLIKNAKDGKRQYLKIAKSMGRSVSTLYRWRKLFIESGSVAALRGAKPGVKKGSRRLVKEMEEVLAELLKNDYLTQQKLSPTDIRERLIIALAKRGIKARAAHINTIRNRIAALDPRAVTKGREGAAAADQQHSENVAILIADYPLAIVQVDHTKLDIIVVTDDEYRLPIGRAWITVVFDVYSRVVLGFYVSLDSPSVQSVGLAIARAVLPKEKWLKALNVTFDWPCWGRPSCVHADNGPDFRSDALKKACLEHHIDMHFTSGHRRARLDRVF